MIAGRLAPVVAVAALALAARTIGAQPASSAANDSLLARAERITVGDYCDVARRVLAVPRAIAVLDSARETASAQVSAATICDPFLSSFTLRALFAGNGAAPENASLHTPLAAVARVHTGGSRSSRREIIEAMRQFRASVRGDVRVPVQEAIGPELNRPLIIVTETAAGLLVAQARDQSLERIRKYERKLGPTSPRLNGPEVLLNYAAQRWIPGFRPTQLGGPSHLEVVASYTPAYVPLTSDRLRAVSASEFGARYYLFGERFGASGWRGLLLPSYWSAGALVVSDRDGALVWPWDGRQRTGAYVSWGSIKVGYVSGRPGGDWLVSKQFQAIPFMF